MSFLARLQNVGRKKNPEISYYRNVAFHRASSERLNPIARTEKNTHERGGYNVGIKYFHFFWEVRRYDASSPSRVRSDGDGKGTTRHVLPSDGTVGTETCAPSIRFDLVAPLAASSRPLTRTKPGFSVYLPTFRYGVLSTATKRLLATVFRRA